MSQNNEDYSKYFEVLDAAIAKLVTSKKQYIDKPNRVNSVLFRKELLELKTVLGQSRQEVLKVNKSQKKPKDKNDSKEDKETKETKEVTVEIVKVVEPVPLEPQAQPVEGEPVTVQMTPEKSVIVVVDTAKKMRKERVQPNKKPRT